MADIEAPVGSKFMLTWTTDANAKVTNVFELIDGTTKEYAGRPPRKGKPPVDTKVILSIVKDGKKDGFRVDVPRPADRERLAGGKFVHDYTFIFQARKVGVYELTVDIPGATPPQKQTKKVTVTPAAPLSDRRQDMLDLFDRWLPSSVMGAQKIPPGETKDILASCGWDTTSARTWTIPAPIPPGKIETLPMSGSEKWTQAGAVITANGQGQLSSAKRSFNNNVLPGRKAAWAALPPDEQKQHPKPTSIPIDTSCISVMARFVGLWGQQFTADLNTMVKADPAFYVKAVDAYAKTPPQHPKPGDILYLVKEHNRGEFQHTCILVSRSDDLWVTADGGGGALPDQTATVNDKPISFTSAKSPPPVPMFASVTDGKTKALHGWVDIDKVPNDKYNPDGSRR